LDKQGKSVDVQCQHHSFAEILFSLITKTQRVFVRTTFFRRMNNNIKYTFCAFMVCLNMIYIIQILSFGIVLKILVCLE